MNISKTSLLFALCCTSTGLFCESSKELKPITVRVGESFKVPVAVHDRYEYYSFEAANAKEVFFPLNPAGATNILIPNSYEWIREVVDDKVYEKHYLKAIKPGTVTISYNCLPTIYDCGCGELNENNGDCVKLCNEETKKQTITDFATVKVTVLPIDAPIPAE